MSNALWVAVMSSLSGLPGIILNLAITRSRIAMRGAMKVGWLLIVAIALIAASLACGTEQSAPANNPPTLTPTAAVATQFPTTRPTAQPTALPTVPSPSHELKVGGHATIHTTDGDKLRIHSRPSFDAPVTVKLSDGTLVTIIAGPQTVGTDHWWQIETADGQGGWAVESAEGVQTLLPAS